MASTKSVLGEVRREQSKSSKRFIPRALPNNIVLGSEGTVDQILANEANNQQKVWTDQFLEEGDEYVSSMNL